MELDTFLMNLVKHRQEILKNRPDLFTLILKKIMETLVLYSNTLMTVRNISGSR